MSQTDKDPAHAGMTDEEIAGLAELDEQLADASADDAEFSPGDVVNGEQEQEEEQTALTPEEEQAKADADAKAAADATAKEAADKEAADAAAAQEQPTRAPILVAEAPEDAEAKLADIASKKAALGDKFDDGDLTSKEYQAELDKLNKDERALERQIDKAQIANELEQQRQTNERQTEINTFLKEVGIPQDPKNMRFRVLDAAVIEVASDEANINLSATEIMQKAYDLCIEHGALQAKKTDPAPKTDPKPAAKKTPIDAPPTLANIPAADTTDTEDNRFNYLNRITDPDKREAAFAKLSAADQEAYLAAGG